MQWDRDVKSLAQCLLHGRGWTHSSSVLLPWDQKTWPEDALPLFTGALGVILVQNPGARWAQACEHHLRTHPEGFRPRDRAETSCWDVVTKGNWLQTMEERGVALRPPPQCYYSSVLQKYTGCRSVGNSLCFRKRRGLSLSVTAWELLSVMFPHTLERWWNQLKKRWHLHLILRWAIPSDHHLVTLLALLGSCVLDGWMWSLHGQDLRQVTW